MDSTVDASVTQQPGTERSPAPAIATLSLALAAIAAVLLLVVVPELPAPVHELHPPWWLLPPCFAVSEFFVVHLRVRRSAFTVSFGHVPLVLGLCLLDPLELLMASVLGAAFTLVVHRRQLGLKLLFNLGLWSFEAAVAVAVYGLLAGGAPATSLHSVLAALATIVVTDQLTALAVSAVIALHEGELDRGSIREALTWGLLVAVCNTSAGLLVVVLLVHRPAAMPLLLVVFAMLLLSYRAYEQLHTAHDQMERQHDFAQALAGVHRADSVISEVLERTRLMLQVEAVELHLSGHVYRCTSEGVEPPRAPTSTTRYWLSRATSGGSVLLAHGTKEPDELDVLERSGAKEGAVAPVRRDAEEEGALVVLDRMGDVASFTADDLRALETFAHQTSVALDRGLLVDRLRQEAADRAHEARHDELTGLPNRAHFLATVDEAVRAGFRIGVLLLDVDRFKDVNDALGHSVGDELLRGVAQRLRAALPPDIALARMGGDEFALMVREIDTMDAVPRTVRTIQAVLASAVSVRDVELHVEVTMGSSAAPTDGDSAEDLLQRADVAMYRAKGLRSPYAPYVAQLDGSGSERLALYTELRAAVAGGLLDVHFQPSLDPATGRVLSVEALARWDHPTRGDVGPEEFIPLAEGSGLITALTHVVLRRALAELRSLRAEGLLSRIAVNLSPRVLHDLDLPQFVASLLREYDVPASVLTLEITESAVMADPPRALAVLRALDALGIHLSVDDYGTGYSSLAYLRQLPVHELKIDRSFVQNLAHDDHDAAIVRSTIELAHQLGLSVVAEGVEDGEALERLRSWGCDAVQGFHLCRPLPGAALATWLRAQDARVAVSSAPGELV